MTPEEETQHIKKLLLEWFKTDEGIRVLGQEIEDRLRIQSRLVALNTKLRGDMELFAIEATEIMRRGQQHLNALNRIVGWGMLRPVIGAVLIALILIGAGTGYLQWNEYNFRQAVARSALITSQNETLMEEATDIRNGVFGVGLAREDDRCFILLPASADVETFWTVTGRRAAEVNCPPSGEAE